MRSSERQQEAEAVQRLQREHTRRQDEALASGRFDEPRSWMARTRDEIASWFGDTSAMRRRQWDEASGDHRGEGPTLLVTADTRIVEELNHRLTLDRELDASGVQVSCREGVVTLDGSVRTSAGAQRAEGLAVSVSGVKGVENKLIVA
jgi:osmotically-inducible protein OsmY